MNTMMAEEQKVNDNYNLFESTVNTLNEECEISVHGGRMPTSGEPKRCRSCLYL